MRTEDPEETETTLTEIEKINKEVNCKVSLLQVYTKYNEFANLVKKTNVCVFLSLKAYVNDGVDRRDRCTKVLLHSIDEFRNIEADRNILYGGHCIAEVEGNKCEGV